MAPKIKRLLLKSSWYRGRFAGCPPRVGKASVGVRLPPNRTRPRSRYRSRLFRFSSLTTIKDRSTGRRGSFLIVLVVVVVLALPVRKAIENDNEHEHD
jgi:hypothetical protein